MRRLVIEKPFLGFGQGPTGNDFLLGPALLHQSPPSEVGW